MGQDSSLNCRGNLSERQQQIQTTNSNAVLIAQSYRNKDKISARSDSIIKRHQYQANLSHQNIKPANAPPNQRHLGHVIGQRYGTSMHFPKNQVVILIQSLVYALAFLYKKRIKHHDFYPPNIAFNQGVFKINNPAHLQGSSYQLTLQRKRFSFLSPELILHLLDEVPQHQVEQQLRYKSDIFAIGMIVLQFCTLEPSAQCYDEQNYSIIDKKIKEGIAKTSRLYSPKIADCVSKMLVYNPEQRIDINNLALAVFLNSRQEKSVVQQQQVSQRMSASRSPRPPQVQTTSLPQQFIVQGPLGVGTQPAHVFAGQNVVMAAPNYNFSRISPSNQGLLSPKTLQNKLRVIERIQENPYEEDDSDYIEPKQKVSVQRPQIQKVSLTSYSDQKTLSNYSLLKTLQPHHSNLITPIDHQYIESQQKSRRSSPPHLQLDENGETINQKIERVLRQSRNIK